MIGTYTGRENATVDRVARYLRENYTRPNDEALNEEDLFELLVVHADTVRKAIRLFSLAFYPAERIAEAEGLDYIGVEAEDDEED